MLDEKKYAISRNVVFHKIATLKTNMLEQVPHKTDGFRFELEKIIGHHSQDDLDETYDQKDDQIR